VLRFSKKRHNMIADAFTTFKSRLELNQSFDEKIRTRHNAVRSALENVESSITTTKLIGSLARKTRIQPLPNDTFDIDILVVRGRFDRWAASGQGMTADSALESFLKIVQKSDRYAAKSPSQDKPTISLKFDDNVKVELVPAYVDNIGHHSNGTAYQPKGRAYWVPKNEGWVLADYDYDAQYVTDMNTQCGGWLVPTIKMLKALKRRYFTEVPSFFFEMVVIRVLGDVVIPGYKKHNLALGFSQLIHDFFNYGRGWLEYSFNFPGSLTDQVKIDAGMAQRTKEMFVKIEQYCAAIDSTSSDTEKQKMWRKLFDDPFPAV
jgi:hypothetical protein